MPFTPADFDYFLKAAMAYKRPKTLLWYCPQHGLVSPDRDCPLEAAWIQAVELFAGRRLSQ